MCKTINIPQNVGKSEFTVPVVLIPQRIKQQLSLKLWKTTNCAKLEDFKSAPPLWELAAHLRPRPKTRSDCAQKMSLQGFFSSSLSERIQQASLYIHRDKETCKMAMTDHQTLKLRLLNRLFPVSAKTGSDATPLLLTCCVTQSRDFFRDPKEWHLHSLWYYHVVWLALHIVYILALTAF